MLGGLSTAVTGPTPCFQPTNRHSEGKQSMFLHKNAVLQNKESDTVVEDDFVTNCNKERLMTLRMLSKKHNLATHQIGRLTVKRQKLSMSTEETEDWESKAAAKYKEGHNLGDLVATLMAATVSPKATTWEKKCSPFFTLCNVIDVDPFLSSSPLVSHLCTQCLGSWSQTATS